MYERGHKEYDKASKWLIMHYGDSLLRLAGVTAIRSWQAVQAEVVQPRRFPDGLIEAVLADGVDRVYLTEIASTYKVAVADQMIEDMLHVYLERKRLPRAILLVLDPDAGEVMAAKQVADADGVCGLRVHWQVIKLADLPADDLLALGDVGLAPWAVLGETSASSADLARRCGEVIDAQATPTDRKSLLAVTQVLLHRRYGSQTPNIFDLLGEKLMPIEVPFIKELLDAQAAQSAAEAAQAIERTAVSEKRSSIVDILDVRFGAVPAAIVARLEEISDLARLGQLRRVSAVCASIAEFEQRLAE